ncbi:WAT1-related protein At5g47470-like [Elaeis guineensis]|uniref:WAT1-related protein At5g47470-like n=1 Tax=Elaeis guineensis var. tenera TaxID=51953 RepID=UPI003C6CE2A8
MYVYFFKVTLLQALILYGTKMTFPAIASTMPNLVPGLIFLIAACLRLEKFDIWCKYTRAKVLGTLVCLGGAMIINFLQSPPSSHQLTSINLLAAVVSLSCYSVLQAVTMRSFPAPLSVCCDLHLVLWASSGTVLTIGYQASQAWGINKKGPVLVAILMPIQTICTTVLSAILLGQTINMKLEEFEGLHYTSKRKKSSDNSPAPKQGRAEPILTQPTISMSQMPVRNLAPRKETTSKVLVMPALKLVTPGEKIPSSSMSSSL